MTVDERLTIDLGDIESVEVECDHCHTTIRYPPGRWSPSESACPGCSKELWRDETKDLSNARGLATALKAVLGSPPDKGTPRIRLQIKHRRDANLTR